MRRDDGTFATNGRKGSSPIAYSEQDPDENDC